MITTKLTDLNDNKVERSQIKKGHCQRKLAVNKRAFKFYFSHVTRIGLLRNMGILEKIDGKGLTVDGPFLTILLLNQLSSQSLRSIQVFIQIFVWSVRGGRRDSEKAKFWTTWFMTSPFVDDSRGVSMGLHILTHAWI